MRRFLFVLMVTMAPALAAQDVTPGAPVRPLSLADALRLAEDASETVGIARAGVARAQGEQMQARSGYYPQLTGSAQYTRLIKTQFSALAGDTLSAPGPIGPCGTFRPRPDLPIAERLDSLERGLDCVANTNPFGGGDGLPFGQPNTYNFGISLSQTLFDAALYARGRAAAAGRRRSEVNLESQRAAVLLDVTQAYYDAVLGERLLAIAESTLVQTERTLSDTRLAREVGTQPEFELLRAEVQRDTQRPVVIQRRAARDLALIRLKQLLDLPQDEPVTLTTGLDDSSAAPLPAFASADTTVEARAAVRASAEGVRAQEGLADAAGAQRLPTLSVNSTYSQIAFGRSLLPSWSDFVTDWAVNVRMSVPIFTGGRVSGDRTVARANLEEARLRLEQTRGQASRDARNTLATLEAAEAAWAASAGTEQQARRAFTIAEIRYREGISTQTELSESRLLLQQALANRAQAARDLQVARTRVALLRDLPLGVSP
jgi:outer membrane protein